MEYLDEILMHMTSILRQVVEEKGGDFEFKNPIPIEGRYGDKAVARRLFVKDGKLHAHLYSGWHMENPDACLESNSEYMSEKCLREVTGLVEGGESYREELRRKFSAWLMHNTEDNPLECYVPIETDDSQGLSSLELPTVTSIFQDEKEGIICLKFDGVDEPVEFDDIDCKELEEIYDSIT